MSGEPGPRWSRRHVLIGGLGAVAAAGVTGFGLVVNDVLPGHQVVNRLLGACSVPETDVAVAEPGPSLSGELSSSARQRTVGYTLAYPPGHGPGDILALVVVLHGHGDDHTSALAGRSLAEAVALQPGGHPLPPFAMVAADGGGGYWHPHPGDDPMAMVMDELIPMCQRQGLGRPPHRIGLLGFSMGGYGALLLAERHPERFAAVAAISPAIWTSYAEARRANRDAFHSSEDFAAHDVIRHAPDLAGTAVRVACGRSDPFRPGVNALADVLSSDAVVEFSKGCHTASYFGAAQPSSLRFLADRITAP